VVVHLRIGSEKGKPIFAAIPVLLHRPLPDGCAIKWVHLLRQRVGPDDKWRVQFVVSRAEGFPRDDQAASGHVGIDLGWRLTPAGLRVASWAGDDGAAGEVVIPAADLDRWQKAGQLQSTRDHNFNRERSRLATWLFDHRQAIPGWLAERTTHLHQWRSPARLTGLVWSWRERRFAGDADIFAELEAWRKHERHLHRYQAGVLRQAQEMREHLYCNAVVGLRRRYHTAHVEDTDWRELARRSRVDEELPAQPYQRRLAAPGRFRELLVEHLSCVVPWPAAYTTQRCHACARVEPFSSRGELEHTCSHCAATWDQDQNAARVLLAYGTGRLKPPGRELREAA
jgi:hypothetical protein